MDRIGSIWPLAVRVRVGTLFGSGYSEWVPEIHYQGFGSVIIIIYGAVHINCIVALYITRIGFGYGYIWDPGLGMDRVLSI